MGDRAMAEIKTGDGSLFVYSHRGGFELPENAKKAIALAKDRWGDIPYATHIIIDQLTKEGRDSETGFGIMLRPNAEDDYNDNQPSVIIDLLKRELTVIRDEETKSIAFLEV